MSDSLGSDLLCMLWIVYSLFIDRACSAVKLDSKSTFIMFFYSNGMLAFNWFYESLNCEIWMWNMDGPKILGTKYQKSIT